MMTDVKGSTKAIEDGRQNDVNIIGAASIAVLMTAMEDEPFPYAFGGDGASALVSNDKAKASEQELRKLREFSRKNFDLELKIGMILLRTLAEWRHDDGCRVYIVKYKLRHGYELAVLRGDASGEEMMKKHNMFVIPEEGANYDNDDTKILSRRTDCATDLSRLFWFLRPIKPSRGKIMSLLISVRDDCGSDDDEKDEESSKSKSKDRLYGEIISKIKSTISVAAAVTTGQQSQDHEKGGNKKNRDENRDVVGDCGLYRADPINIDAMEFQLLNYLFAHGKKFLSSIGLPYVQRIAGMFMWLLCGSKTLLDCESSVFSS